MRNRILAKLVHDSAAFVAIGTIGSYHAIVSSGGHAYESGAESNEHVFKTYCSNSENWIEWHVLIKVHGSITAAGLLGVRVVRSSVLAASFFYIRGRPLR